MTRNLSPGSSGSECSFGKLPDASHEASYVGQAPHVSLIRSMVGWSLLVLACTGGASGTLSNVAGPGGAGRLVGRLTVGLLGGFSAWVVLLLVAAPGWAGLWPAMLAGSGCYLVAEVMHRHPPPACCCPRSAEHT